MTELTHPRIDLHTHTTASDGQDTPAELVNFAVQQGISVLGVTDHDTMDALAEVQQLAENAGITLIPGVELSTTVDRAEVHVLGYFVDINDDGFTTALAEQAASRFSRVERMIEKVQRLGYDIDGDAILAQADFGTIGRPHVARALIEIGAATDVSDAFDRFLKAGRPGYIPRDPFSPEDAVNLLAKHNAIPVLAHPYSTRDIAGILNRLVPLGLRGLETYYAEYSQQQHEELRGIADEWELIPTGGSDYHGVGFREGRILGSAPVPSEVAERLFEAHEGAAMNAVAVIVAAGSGERFGNAAKVMAPLMGRPVLAWSLDAFSASSLTTGIVIVVGPHTESDVGSLLSTGTWQKVIAVVTGGDTRQQSMANGVAAVPDDADVVLVHDAARPLVLPEDIDACIEAAVEHGGAILAAPVTDTIKRIDHGRIAETIDRSMLWGAQTPQAFRAESMRAMAELAVTSEPNITDEASLAERLGYPVQIVVSDSTNLKITHPHDLLIAEAILRARKERTA